MGDDDDDDEDETFRFDDTKFSFWFLRITRPFRDAIFFLLTSASSRSLSDSSRSLARRSKFEGGLGMTLFFSSLLLFLLLLLLTLTLFW